MTARAIWKGNIRIGGMSVPVKFYSAILDKNIHFRLLHETDLTPVEQKMVHSETGKPVPADQVRRGAETGDGQIIMLSDAELESLSPEASRDIEITRFVQPAVINHQWYDRPYYMGPDGQTDLYFALARALAQENKEGVCRWTMRKKRYIGALGAQNGFLRMITLRHAEEVVDASVIPRPETRDLSPQELKMAEQLVGALEGEFEPAAYRSEYREQVMAMIRAKAGGRTIPFRKPEAPKPAAASLADMLQKSLERTKGVRRHA